MGVILGQEMEVSREDSEWTLSGLYGKVFGWKV